MKKMKNLMPVIISIVLLNACGSATTGADTITNTIIGDPILGKWYPYESWIDNNNNNIQDNGEWLVYDANYKQQLAMANMTMEDISMTFLTNNEGFVSAFKSDSSMFNWKNNGGKNYQMTVVEKGVSETEMIALQTDGHLFLHANTNAKNRADEKAIRWRRTP
jgi:hypothetical protein